VHFSRGKTRFLFKGVALIEHHPIMGYFIKGTFPINLLMDKGRLFDIAMKIWTLPHVESLSGDMKFTYALFDEIDVLCAISFYKKGLNYYALCAFFEAAYADSIWKNLEKVKEILRTYSFKSIISGKRSMRNLILLYRELMGVFINQKPKSSIVRNSSAVFLPEISK